MNPIDNAWMLLKEVTLEDLRQAARTGGLPATPERIQAARGHSGIPAALAGIEPFQRFGDGQTSGTANQRMAERMMAAQHEGRLNEFGQPHEEGYDQSARLDRPQSFKDQDELDEARHNPDSGNINPDKIFLPDDSMPEPMTVQPPEDSRPETMPQMQQLGQSLADFPEFPEGVQPDPDAGRRQFEAQANRARSLAARSAQQSTASPMDAAMQALGNRKAEEAARVPKPVQRRALNTRRGGRGRGPNSRRNRRR